MIYKLIKVLSIFFLILASNYSFSQSVTVSGNISTGNGVALNQVTVTTNNGPYSTVSDDAGNYTLELPINSTHTLEFERNINFSEGVSFRDVIAVYKHILGITNDFSMEQQIAADISNDGNISTFDMVIINQLMFDINNVDIESWNFYRSNGTFTVDNLQSDVEGIDIIGIKLGNVDCH